MSLLLAAVSSTSSYTPLVYIVGTLFAGGLLQLLYTVVRNWKRTPIEDRELIAGSVRNDVSSLKDLLAEYRLEVEINKRHLEDYRLQLTQITLDLAKAQARISTLESQLDGAKGERTSLAAQLDEVKAMRDRLQMERDRLAEEADRLRERIRKLEDATGITERLARLHEERDEPISQTPG